MRLRPSVRYILVSGDRQVFADVPRQYCLEPDPNAVLAKRVAAVWKSGINKSALVTPLMNTVNLHERMPHFAQTDRTLDPIQQSAQLGLTKLQGL